MFLSIKRGGCGITSISNTAKGAFVGSIALIAHQIGKIYPECLESCDGPTMREFNEITDELKSTDNEFCTVLENPLDINAKSVWDGRFYHVQKKLNEDYHGQNRSTIITEWWRRMWISVARSIF
jgi:hypothetical protein